MYSKYKNNNSNNNCLNFVKSRYMRVQDHQQNVFDDARVKQKIQDNQIIYQNKKITKLITTDLNQHKIKKSVDLEDLIANEMQSVNLNDYKNKIRERSLETEGKYLLNHKAQESLIHIKEDINNQNQNFNRKKSMGKSKLVSQKFQTKKSIDKLIKIQKELNLHSSAIKFPEIKIKVQQSKHDIEQSSPILYNDYIRQNYFELKFGELRKLNLEKNISDQINMKLSKKYSFFSKRYERNEKLIQTAYEYQKLIQMKQEKLMKEWRQYRQKDQKQINKKDTSDIHKQTVGQISQSNQKIYSNPLSKDREYLKRNLKVSNGNPNELKIESITRKQSIISQKSPNKTQINNSPFISRDLTLQQDQSKFQSTKSIKNKFPHILKIKDIYPKQITVYQKKISTYREFIFQLNFAHNRYDPLILKDEINLNKNDLKYKVYVGSGNNSLLIKSLIKRRYWWILEDDIKNCNFVWTQLKISNYFNQEKQSKPLQVNDVSYKQQNLKNNQVSKSTKVEKSIKYNKAQQQKSISKKKNNKPFLRKGIEKIFNSKDQDIYKRYQKLLNTQVNKIQDYDIRVKYIEKKLIAVSSEERYNYRVHNHLQCNYYIGNKKAMFYNMRQYYRLRNKNVFEYLPLTFHIKNGINDKQYKQFVKYFTKKQHILKKKQQLQYDNIKTKNTEKNIWIIKPGQISNRGNGITVVDQLYEVNNILKKNQKHPNGSQKTYIIQAYIQKPLLYHKRKFDIRHYMLITTLYGKMRAYWYSQGYIRTSSQQYDIEDLGNQMIHLTNDAIQKNGEHYGKYEQGNKISYSQFQRYLDQTYPEKKIQFYQYIYPKMKNIATDAVKASYLRLDPRRLQHNFQIFGLDFMIDRNFNLWLIQINTNPCLQISSGLLGRIIPLMVEQSFRLSLDVLFPPFAHYPNTQKHLTPDNALQNLKYQLIFDEQTQGKQLIALYQNNLELNCGQIDEDDQIYDNEGKEYQIDALL